MRVGRTSSCEVVNFHLLFFYLNYDNMENQVESTSTAPPSEFHLFSKLPAELRRIIWLMILPAPRALVCRDVMKPQRCMRYIIDSVNQESRSIFKSLYTRLLPPDPVAMGWGSELLYEKDPREWPLYADLSREIFWLCWDDLRPINNGRSIVQWLTPQAVNGVKHMAFWFIGCPNGVGRDIVFSVADLKKAYDTLEQQIRVFSDLETLILVLEEWEWRGPSLYAPALNPIPGREDPMWRAHLELIDSMRNLKGRPTVKVEVKGWESMKM